MTSYRRTNEPSPLEVEGSTAGASGGRDHGRTFTDKDLYELMALHMPSIFWAEWEYLSLRLQRSVEGLANDIWERLT